ncbi:hypothetical protein G9A89_014757 [Geosiphon pyriformis]|nr:hypothetical protein G9A89_014757 [Geosiphon pyriformis]
MTAPSNASALHLYRNAMRFVCSKEFPFRYMQRKMKYNIRDLYDIYRDEKDEEKVKLLIERGYQDLETLKAWMFVEPNVIKKIFRGFGEPTIPLAELGKENRELEEENQQI